MTLTLAYLVDYLILIRIIKLYVYANLLYQVWTIRLCLGVGRGKRYACMSCYVSMALSLPGIQKYYSCTIMLQVESDETVYESV